MKARVCQNPQNPIVSSLFGSVFEAGKTVILVALQAQMLMRIETAQSLSDSRGTHQKLCHWLTDRAIWERRPIANPSKTLCLRLKAFKKCNHRFLQGILQQHLWPTRTFCGYCFLSTAVVHCTVFHFEPNHRMQSPLPNWQSAMQLFTCLEGSFFEIKDLKKVGVRRMVFVDTPETPYYLPNHTPPLSQECCSG